MLEACNGARPYHRKDSPIRRNAVIEAIKDLQHGIPLAITANRLGVSHDQLSYWVRHNIDAYHARLYFITNSNLARDPKKDAFHKRMRLERLVTYRKLHGMPPNPSPGYRKRLKDTPSVDD